MQFQKNLNKILETTLQHSNSIKTNMVGGIRILKKVSYVNLSQVHGRGKFLYVNVLEDLSTNWKTKVRTTSSSCAYEHA